MIDLNYTYISTSEIFKDIIFIKDFEILWYIIIWLLIIFLRTAVSELWIYGMPGPVADGECGTEIRIKLSFDCVLAMTLFKFISSLIHLISTRE